MGTLTKVDFFFVLIKYFTDFQINLLLKHFELMMKKLNLQT